MARTRRHALLNVLVMALCGVIAGADGWKQLALFARTRASGTTYYLTSLPPKARKLARIIRTHWGVDNGLHWSLDVCLGEDSRRIRDHKGAQNFALLSRRALTALRRESTEKPGVPSRRKLAGWDNEYRLRVLMAVFTGL